MEEVWNDINLASLNDHNTPSNTTASNFRNMILQDFLGRPFSIKDVPTSIASSTTDADSLYATASPLPLPATILSLSSAPELNFLNSGGPMMPSNLQIVQSGNLITDVTASFSNPVAPSSDLPCFSRKRVSESDSSSGDRRHKRSIKNRESAARSRARKQAYTNELELEVNRLLEENARLRNQQQQLCLAAEASSHQHTKKQSLQRSSTAPF